MISKVLSSGLTGIDGYIVEVEVDISQGLPAFDIVGLPDSAVKESKDRVRTAIKNTQINFPIKRITVNLAPANTKKEGPSFDLPIAIGILCCIGLINNEKVKNTLIIGELSLDGSVKPVSGILPMIHSAKNLGVENFIIPYENIDEASLIDDVKIIGVKSLYEVINHFNNKKIEPVNIDIKKIFENEVLKTDLDFSDVKGQENVKRAIEIAAAGMHNLIMVGPPGSGKTMMAKRIPTILPNISFEESIEITKIYSVAGLIKNRSSLITKRPFRAPHHTISNSAMVGGGRIPKPGEVSLAHNGVLFLDELPEFHRNVLEELRQPLEDNEVTISRVNGTMTFPANLMLVAAMNPCPCGFYGYSQKCNCSQNKISKYISKISGPLLDRIDIQIEAAAVNYKDLSVKTNTETSKKIKDRVVKAQQIQLNRYEKDGIYFNSQLTASLIDKYCYLESQEKELLKGIFDKLQLSARAYHKILKIARTIADLDSNENINVKHIAEAVQLRNLDRKIIF